MALAGLVRQESGVEQYLKEIQVKVKLPSFTAKFAKVGGATTVTVND